MVNRFFDWMMLLLYVAVIFLLVRPRSQGPKLIDTIGSKFVALVQSVTGGGKW